jgi:hypothetical protein
VGVARVETGRLVGAMVESKIARPRPTQEHVAIPVFIYGHKESGQPFKEINETIAVSANGCLVELLTPVVKGQPLFLTNLKTNEELACSVVTLGNIANGKTEVALCFTQASPHFWGIGFPPEDWEPADRERPAPPKQ